MTYLHPRDFDEKQPIINELSMIRKFKSYVGLKSAGAKFIRWQNDFKFVDIHTADLMTDWKNTRIIDVSGL